MTTALPTAAVLPAVTHAELHPAWCDPRTCKVEPEFGRGATHYLHTLVLLAEAPAGQPERNERGYDQRIRVEVERSDLRRDVDGVVVDCWNEPTELDPVTVYVYGLDQVNLDADQGRRVAEAMGQAAAVVAAAGGRATTTE